MPIPLKTLQVSLATAVAAPTYSATAVAECYEPVESLPEQTGTVDFVDSHRNDGRLFCTTCTEDDRVDRKTNLLLEALRKNDLTQALELIKDPSIDIGTSATNSIFHLAAKRQNPRIVRYLAARARKEGIDLAGFENALGQTPLELAIVNSNSAVVQEFINESPDGIETRFGKYNYTPLLYAVRYGKADVVKQFIDMGADLTAATISGFTPIDVASLYPEASVEDLRLVLEAMRKNLLLQDFINSGICIGEDRGNTPLHLAAREGNPDKVRFLLGYGANVNAKTESGLTPLHLAIIFHNTDAVSALIKAPGVELDSKANIEFGQLRTREKFKYKFHKRPCAREEDVTPLQLAIINGDKETVDILLSSPDDLDIDGQTGIVGSTAAHLAAVRGNSGIMKLLLQRGYPKLIKNHEGRTPAEVVSGRRHQRVRILDLLQRYPCI